MGAPARMFLVNRNSAISARPQAPYTVKNPMPLRRQTRHGMKSRGTKKLVHRFPLRHIDLHEAKRRMTPQNLQARGFEARVVVGIEVVESDHLLAALEQPPRGMKSNEPGGAGD